MAVSLALSVELRVRGCLEMTTPYPVEKPRTFLEVDDHITASTSPAEVLELVAYVLEHGEVE